jgi:4-hydroxy-4-methyl-2-oxoglutarate aldolase
MLAEEYLMTTDGSENLSERLGRLYTGAIADVLDELGYRLQTLPPNIAPLRTGMRLAGPAFTVEGRANPGCDFESSVRGILTMLGRVPAGHVVVYQANDDEAAHLGELSVAALKTRGCRGALLDGGVRDVDLTLQQNFPVFCRYTTPQDGPGRWEVTACGSEIRIGKTLIATGDFIVADADGALVVPAAVTEVVLERAEQVAATENEVRAAVLKGLEPLTAYEEFGRF